MEDLMGESESPNVQLPPQTSMSTEAGGKSAQPSVGACDACRTRKVSFFLTTDHPILPVDCQIRFAVWPTRIQCQKSVKDVPELVESVSTHHIPRLVGGSEPTRESKSSRRR